MENTTTFTTTATTTNTTVTTSNTAIVQIVNDLLPTQSSFPLEPLIADWAHINVTAVKPKNRCDS